MLRYAVEHLLRRYLNGPGELMQPARVADLRRTVRKLEAISPALPSELTSRAVAMYLMNLPQYHEHYVDALLLAELIVGEKGLAIRDPEGQTVLPTILIDMETIFENYARQLLADHFAIRGGMDVLNGNKFGTGGARTRMFDAHRPGLKNPDMTPDIVLTDEQVTALVIDVKYKPQKEIPDRSDLNQVFTYAIKYKCKRVMILYPTRGTTEKPVQFVGTIGNVDLYTAHIDLIADGIEVEENNFTEEIYRLVTASVPPADV